MTTERAIQLLHRLSDEQFDGIHGDERRNALEMAVRALSGDGDTISRQQAIDALKELREKTIASESFRLGIYYSMEEIKKVPSAQSERKKGKWHYPDGTPATIGRSFGVICDRCETESEYCTNFCGECGADMRGESND